MPLGLVPALAAMSKPSPALARGVEWAPPKGFRAAVGVQSAWPIGEGPFGCTPRRANSAAKRSGLRYEKKALKHLSDLLGGSFTPHQWFRFYDGHGVRFCQVDGMLRAGEDLVVFEVKINFCADAWWQLRKLYEPVVRCALRPRNIGLVVVCRSFDPAVAFPEPYERLTELGAAWPPMGVFQWKV